MKVLELFEYPVKGLRGSAIACATVNNRGLNMDRRWMLVDRSHSFISQRQFSELTQIRPSYAGELIIEHLPTAQSINVADESFNKKIEVEVWGQIVPAHSLDHEVNQWLSGILGQQVELVFMKDTDLRPIKSLKDDSIVSFADGYPVLLTGSASLADLNERLDNPISIDRFRTNIHAVTSTPFEEEGWKKIKVGEVIFDVVKKCARCHVITIDQESGKAGTKEPLKTLSTYRREGNNVNFGMNLVPLNQGIIHVDDQIEVLV